MAVEFLICSRCDAIGHSAESCPHYRQEREQHQDAAWGDSVRHMQETNISITCNGIELLHHHKVAGWWEHQQVEICVNNLWLVLGRASGQGCNCLIYSLKQILPTPFFDIAFVRAEVERRHRGRPTAIIPWDYLDLLVWSDIVDIIGEHN